MVLKDRRSRPCAAKRVALTRQGVMNSRGRARCIPVSAFVKERLGGRAGARLLHAAEGRFQRVHRHIVGDLPQSRALTSARTIRGAAPMLTVLKRDRAEGHPGASWEVKRFPGRTCRMVKIR